MAVCPPCSLQTWLQPCLLFTDNKLTPADSLRHPALARSWPPSSSVETCSRQPSCLQPLINHAVFTTIRAESGNANPKKRLGWSRCIIHHRRGANELLHQDAWLLRVRLLREPHCGFTVEEYTMYSDVSTLCCRVQLWTASLFTVKVYWKYAQILMSRYWNDGVHYLMPYPLFEL